MKNRTKIILVVIIITALFILGKDFFNKKEVKKEENGNVTQNEEVIISDSFENKTLNKEDPYVKFDIKYPYFKNADKDFNLKIEKVITDQIPDFISSSKENWQARYDTQTKGDNIPKIPQKDEDKFSFYSDFNIVQSNSKYISFVLVHGGFIGGAHGYETKTSFNYDVKNQKTIELKDLFINNTDYLKYLSDKSREYLKKEFLISGEEDKESYTAEDLRDNENFIISLIEEGTIPTDDNFKVFTFVDNKVKIYFGQYQVGAYAMGTPEFEVEIK